MTIFKNLAFAFILCSLGTAAYAGEHQAPASVQGTELVTTVQAKELFDQGGVIFVDARQDSAFEEGRIPGAIHLDAKKEGTYTPEILARELPDKAAVIITYCNGEKCTRSSISASNLVNAGYTNVKYFREGYPGWTNAGYPTE